MAFYLDRPTFVRMVDAARAETAAPHLKRWEEIHEALRTCFAGATPQENARELGKACVIAHTRLGDELIPYHGFASTIFDALRKAEGAAPTEQQWETAMGILASHEEVLANLQSSPSAIVRMNAAAAAIGRASAELERMGFSLLVTDKGEIDLSHSERDRLGRAIDELASSVGGQALLRWIFEQLDRQGRYEEEIERWMLTRTSDSLQGLAPVPQLPWGYLYHLGVKHFHEQGRHDRDDLGKLILLVRDSTTLMAVQPYTGMEGMVLGSNSLMPFLLESVVYDSLFTFSQFRARDACRLVLFLATGLESKCNDVNDAQLVEVAHTAAALLAQAHPKRPKVVRAKDVGRALRCSPAQVNVHLEKVFAHQDAPNAKLKYPPSSTEIDFDDRPLLKLKEGAYLCPPQSLCGKAVVQAFLELCEDNVENFGGRIGPLLEDFFLDFARQRGLQPKHGKYSVGKTISDCDMVVETQDTIVFLEVKKKGLNRLSRSGNEHSDMELLMDLARSVIKSQQQALLHESLLRENGGLRLSPRNGEQTELVWNNQKICRVSVSLFDSGSLHHRNTLMQFLETGSTSTVHSSNLDHQDKTTEVNESFAGLRKLAMAAGVLNERHAFDNCYLLSAPQLLLLLDSSSSNEDFVEVLTRGSRVFVNSKDFYDHHLFSRKLHRIRS